MSAGTPNIYKLSAEQREVLDFIGMGGTVEYIPDPEQVPETFNENERKPHKVTADKKRGGDE